MDNNKQPPREAVALEYDPAQGAPRVTAAGKGLIAERIIESALSAGIPLHKDPELIKALNMLDIGERIPTELYQVVAQILVFVSDMDKKTAEAMRPIAVKRKI